MISDTCPISCHFARTCSPDPALGVEPPEIAAIVVDSAKQARYIRDMVHCPTLLTSTENAVETAVAGASNPTDFQTKLSLEGAVPEGEPVDERSLEQLEIDSDERF